MRVSESRDNLFSLPSESILDKKSFFYQFYMYLCKLFNQLNFIENAKNENKRRREETL